MARNELAMPRNEPRRPRQETVEEVFAGSVLDGNGSLTQQVYRLMWDLIVGLRLLPNQYLSEKDVAAMLGISRTPVREAFLRLSEDALLDIRPKSGSYVSPINIARAYESYLIRSLLESECAAKLAAAGIDEGTERILRRVLDQQENAVVRNDFRKWHPLDVKFHADLFTIADLPTMRRLVYVANFEVDRVKNLRAVYGMGGSRDLRIVFSEHVMIIDAIAERDAERARTAVVKHLSDTNSAIGAIVRDERFWNMFHIVNNSQKTGRKNRQSE